MPEDPAPAPEAAAAAGGASGPEAGAEAPITGLRLVVVVVATIVVLTLLSLGLMQLTGPFIDRDPAAAATTTTTAPPPGADPAAGAGWRCTSQDYPLGEKRGASELAAIATLTTPGAKAPEGWTRIEPNRWQQRDQSGTIVVERTASLHEDFVEVWSVVRLDRCEHDLPG